MKMPPQNLLRLLLLLIMMMRIVLATVCCRFRLSAQGLVKSLKLKFRRDFAADVWLRLRSRILAKIMKLGLIKIMKPGLFKTLSLSLVDMLKFG